MSDCTHFSVYLTYCQDRNNLWTLNKVVKSNSDYHLKEVKGGHFSQYLKKVTQKRDWKKWDQIKNRDRFFFVRTSLKEANNKQ